MEVIKGSILSTLKLYLHNDDITLSMRVAEKKEHKILTRKEQYELMASKSPSVALLQKMFDLELA